MTRKLKQAGSICEKEILNLRGFVVGFFFSFLTSSMSTWTFQVFYWLMHPANAALQWDKQLLR